MTIEFDRRELANDTAHFAASLLRNQDRYAPFTGFPNVDMKNLRAFIRSTTAGDRIGLSPETCELLVGTGLENMDSHDEEELTPAERIERRQRLEKIGPSPDDIPHKSLWDRFAAAGRIAAIMYGDPAVQFAVPWWCDNDFVDFQRVQGLSPVELASPADQADSSESVSALSFDLLWGISGASQSRTASEILRSPAHAELTRVVPEVPASVDQLRELFWRAASSSTARGSAAESAPVAQEVHQRNAPGDGMTL